MIQKHRELQTVAPALLALVVIFASCGAGGGDGTITEARTAIRKISIPDGPDDMAHRIGFGSRTQNHAHTPAAGPPTYSFTLPAGWAEGTPSQFRQADFQIAGAPDLDAYLSVLPGAGGGALANLNRWRGQMGLEPTTIEEASKLPTVPMLGLGAALVDFEGTFGGMGRGTPKPDYRMVGVLAMDQGYGVFLKLVGSKDAVAKERENFLALCQSIKPKGTPVTPRSFDPGRLAWTAPANWEQGPAKPMREVTYRPAGTEGVECYISVLVGTGGGLVANLNRWQGQAGQGALSIEQIKALPQIMVLGTPSKFLEVAGAFQGMDGPERQGFMLLGVACELASHSVFVKMTGPAEVVRAERDNFLQFCKSLRQVK
jgi:hypothetical protein